MGALTVEVAKVLTRALESRRPRWTQVRLSRVSGIEASALSRMLTPSKPMLVEEFVSICSALRLDPGEVLEEARSRCIESTPNTRTVRETAAGEPPQHEESAPFRTPRQS